MQGSPHPRPAAHTALEAGPGQAPWDTGRETVVNPAPRELWLDGCIRLQQTRSGTPCVRGTGRGGYSTAPALTGLVAPSHLLLRPLPHSMTRAELWGRDAVACKADTVPTWPLTESCWFWPPGTLSSRSLTRATGAISKPPPATEETYDRQVTGISIMCLPLPPHPQNATVSLRPGRTVWEL